VVVDVNAEPLFSQARFESLLGTSWAGRELHYLATVGSTMDVARGLAGDGARHGAVVLADEQRQGRGRLGRQWLSPRGVNLYFSIILRPTVDRLRALAMIAPLAIVDGLRQATGLACTLKWPNDVQFEARKLGGVLIESELAGDEPALAIVGAGINVNYDPSHESEISAIATSVMKETGTAQERELVLAETLNAFEDWYEAPVAAVQGAWRSRLTTLGQQVRVSFPSRVEEGLTTVEEGLAEDVTAHGSLVLRRADGSSVTLPAGEVSLRQEA
ncbi:MAG TPA: biotin--[acetyl-CoA-carboxylase] ligase, partial [Bryobacteraceae bacterium]|nr:biotin--[acetyl-CoA-carboxylase] ligase [Bryobacteraceae bacterium]